MVLKPATSQDPRPASNGMLKPEQSNAPIARKSSEPIAASNENRNTIKANNPSK